MVFLFLGVYVTFSLVLDDMLLLDDSDDTY